MMAEPLPKLLYPVLLWYEGYIYRARTLLELCAGARSDHKEMVRRSKDGKVHLLDAHGRYFKIVDWRRIPPFGGVKALPYLLTLSVFAVPLLGDERQLSLLEFKKKLKGAIGSRYHYDLGATPVGETIEGIEAADSYEAALAALPKLI